MAVTQKRIEKNLAAVRETIARACETAGRDPAQVRIVAVTKTVDLETVKNAVDAGLTDLGENRVQPFAARAAELDAYLQRRRQDRPRSVRWHMIGHLQRNKVKSVLEWATMVHSVDSLRLAEEISTRAEKMHRTVEILLQVNCSQEAQKFGCAVGAAVHLAELITTLPRIRLVGLMTMGPKTGRPEESRHAFVRLRELFEEIRNDKIGGDIFRHLSMGMSLDYPIAVAEGATMVRIGSALFATS